MRLARALVRHVHQARAGGLGKGLGCDVLRAAGASRRVAQRRRIAVVTGGLAVASIAGSVAIATVAHGETTSSKSTSSTSTTSSSTSNTSDSTGSVSSTSGGAQTTDQQAGLMRGQVQSGLFLRNIIIASGIKSDPATRANSAEVIARRLSANAEKSLSTCSARSRARATMLME